MEVETQKPPLSEIWTRWEGQSVNGAFPLRRCLGSSDHSGVFLTEYAEQSVPNVALKLVPAIPTLAESQLSHWSAAAALEHPHLIRLMETGRCQLGGSHYLYVVMDYAEQNLEHLLQHRALTEAEVREMMPLTLEALAFLHAKDFVHGQLKPSNVLVVGSQLKLSSDTIRPADEATASIGMLSIHDPPEARDGSFSTAGDIWALGVTLCEALTQRTPTRAGERRDVVLLPPDIPAAFNDILRRCLARNPAQRPSVADLLEWLKKGPPAAGASVPAAAVDATPPPAAAVAAAAKPESNGATRLVIRAVINKEPPPEEPVERRSVVPWVVAAVAVVAVGWGAWSWFKGQSGGVPAKSQNGEQTSDTVSDATSRPASPASAAAPQSANSTSANTAAANSSADAAANSSGTSPGDSTASGSSVPSRNAHVTRLASGLTAASVLQEDIPSVPARSRGTIHGRIKVTVRVTVDNSGAVVEDDLVREGPSKYFARLASESARKWRFKPADGAASRQSLIRFEFTRSSTTGHVVTAD